MCTLRFPQACWRLSDMTLCHWVSSCNVKMMRVPPSSGWTVQRISLTLKMKCWALPVQQHSTTPQTVQHVRTHGGSKQVTTVDLTQFSCVIWLSMLKYFLLNSCCLLFSYLHYASWWTSRFMFHMHADGCHFSHTIHLWNSSFIFRLTVKKLFIFIQQNVSTVSPV